MGAEASSAAPGSEAVGEPLLPGMEPEVPAAARTREPGAHPAPAGREVRSDAELAVVTEALLFVSDGPIPERTLARVLESTPGRVGAALELLGVSLTGRGLRLQRGPEGAQLVTAPELAPVVEGFIGVEGRRRLSAAAMETLAIVAYRQPITRGQIERIRGVSSDAALATLRARDLVVEVGRAPGPGRPSLFGVTQRFLEHFGIESLRQLPPLEAEPAGAADELEEAVGVEAPEEG